MTPATETSTQSNTIIKERRHKTEENARQTMSYIMCNLQLVKIHCNITQKAHHLFLPNPNYWAHLESKCA